MLTQNAAEQTRDARTSATDIGSADGQEQGISQPASPDPVDLDTEDGLAETEFLATISHELRSPLAAIKGYAATLRRYGSKLGRVERDEFLQAIEEASDRLEMIISRLLQLARLETGALTPSLVSVNGVHLVREAIAAAANRWASGTGEVPKYVFIAPEQDDMPQALADLQLQREVLDIVLENAVKYSPGGGIIRVTLQTDGARLFIHVEDRGLGIPSNHLNRIFERFHRVDTRLTREVEGAGLGLAIAKRIMELQDGNIWVESQPGVGSTFSMALPLVRPRDLSDDNGASDDNGGNGGNVREIG
ncbi:MAG TPA: HAMP domain-containing sensor histidine kinase [Ktedonobacterales bacterium]|nr:HAMP domain-containing sensor histidine kinase [Ktedonobacterales bacterium]